MREIKFRAWDTEEKKMYYGITLSSYCQECGEWKSDKGDFGMVNAIEFMQYTGLKDKNRKEIYEGDIVKCIEMHDGNLFAFLNNKPISLEVRWDNENASFVIGKYPDDNNLFQSLMSCFKVIGNIYENPDLLKGEHE